MESHNFESEVIYIKRKTEECTQTYPKNNNQHMLDLIREWNKARLNTKILRNEKKSIANAHYS